MADEVSTGEKESWMNSKWRPAMGWMYMVVCIADFVVFPILWSILQAVLHGQVTQQWDPLTLKGAGLFHMAMGAVLGVAAFGRTQEKLAGATNVGTTTGFGAPSGITTPSAPTTGGFGAPSSGFGTATPSTGGFGSVPATTPSGKLIVPQGPQPEL